MPISAPPKWTDIKNKPTTMAGYGITDEKCRAWVNFNGTGTVAIRGSANVSSITDNGTEDYTINFTTSMPDESYATQVTSAYSTTAGYNSYTNNSPLGGISQTASAVRISGCVGSDAAEARDAPYFSVSIYR